MKIVTIIARVLLGLIFIVFGSNIFFHFIPMPPPPPGPAGQFMGALFGTHYMYVVGAFQVLGGVLVWSCYAPLGIALLAPVIVNILTFHSLMAPSGLPLAIVVAVLAVFLGFHYRAHFAGLFQPVARCAGTAADGRSSAQPSAVKERIDTAGVPVRGNGVLVRKVLGMKNSLDRREQIGRERGKTEGSQRATRGRGGGRE